MQVCVYMYIDGEIYFWGILQEIDKIVLSNGAI